MTLKNKTTPFQKIDYKKEIETELNGGRELNALFLIHGFIEAYLREWLFTVGKVTKDKIKRTAIKEIERISFKNILLTHLVLGNIDHTMYAKICNINDVRNDLAHQLITIDMNDATTKNKLKSSALFGINLCDEIFSLYKQDLDRKAKELVK